MAGDHDDRQGRIQRLKPIQHLTSVQAGHPQVRDDHAREVGIDSLQRRIGAGEGMDVQTLQRQPLDQGLAEIGVVLDQGDGGQAGELHQAILSVATKAAP